MGNKEEQSKKILELVEDYNSLCALSMLQHRLKYNTLNEQLVLGNREQLSYGSYQCELVRGAAKAKEFVESALKIMCFEHGE